MARFPPGYLDALKAQADIVQVVQAVVSLRRAGASLKGLCPFHTEKTPSFHVNAERGFFHCFGCGTGGDVIKFVQLHEHMTFPDAVAALAERFGMPPPATDESERDVAAEAERESLLTLHEAARDHFREALASPAGAVARSHLEERGVRPETVERLGLGFAPPGREGLKRRLLDAGHSLDLLLRSGLVVERDGGRTVDRFHSRLMIPICRDSGSVVAFGGRALAAGQQPKYVNSPESPLYRKGRTLYGLHVTRQAIRRCGYAILVEGYFDLAQVVQAGFEPLAAVCGTALTGEQARLLRRFARKVIVAFDPDAAGQEAARRSGELLLAEGFDVNVLRLPDGEDPDACIRKRGADAFRAALRSSQPYLTFALDRAAAGRDFSRDQPRRAFLSEMLAVAARIPDPAARDQFADRLAHRTGVLDDVVRAELRRAAVARRTDLAGLPPAVEGPAAAGDAPTAEKGLIWALVREPAAALAALDALDPEDLRDLASGSILPIGRSLAGFPPESVPDTLIERLGADEAALVTDIAAAPAAPVLAPKDCGRELQRRRYQRERAALQHEIDRRQREGALADIDALLRRKRDLQQQLEALNA